MEHYHRGKSNFENSRFKEALTNFNVALRQDPEFASAYIYRGLTKEALGNYHEALPDYT